MDPASPHPRLPEEPVDIEGPVGNLEGLYRPVASKNSPVSLVLCHPHPLHGGTMNNKTLFRIAKQVPLEVGVPCLRFNFRGTGNSEGVHDHARGEVEDALAAIDWSAHRHPSARQIVVGYSFGAAVGLRAALAHESVTHLVALGLPLRGEWSLDFLSRTNRPRLFVHGERDEFGDEDALRAFVATLPPPHHIHVVAGANHLFEGQEDEAVSAVVAFVAEALGGSEPGPELN